MPRFVYHAAGLALGGHITRPVDHYIEAQASCALPSTGGKARATAPAFSLTLAGEFILSFDSAETTIEGTESSPGVHRTTLTSTIRKLNVANVLKADEVTVKLTAQYDLGTDRPTLDSSDSRYVNLTIAGERWDVTIDHALGREASDYEQFKKTHPTHPEGHNRILHCLARHPRLKFAPPELGYHHQPGFGRIYFCEWTAAPNTQGLTMMRLRLGSPQEGDLTIGGGSSNGSPYPP